jgi:signal transduction histidine kinase
LRRELVILLPAALLLLVVVSTFTLFSYRGALAQLAEERQEETVRLARGIADRLVAAGGALPTAEQLNSLAPPGVRGVALFDAGGRQLAANGELPPVPLGAGLSALQPRPFALGPDADLPDAVAGFAPLVVPAPAAPPSPPSPSVPPTTRPALLFVRVDLPAATLGAQLRAVRLLSWWVLPVNSALVVLVLLFLSRLMRPFETLLARARELEATTSGDASADEDELLLRTLERAIETLGERRRDAADAGGDAAASAEPRHTDDDLAALERTLAASLESGLLLLGRDGRVLSLNVLGAALLGATPRPGGAAPPTLAELLAPHPELLALLTAAIAAGQPIKRQEIALHAAGGPAEPRLLGLSLHPLRRDDGVTRGFLVLFADLTEARRRAEEMRFADRLSTLGEMAAGVAHELRNSLATLRGYLTLIERRPDEDAITDFLAEIRHESDHLQRVLEDFLAFARPGTARLEVFSMLALARRAAADPALAGIAVDIVVEGKAGETALRGDPQLIERALRNLLHNAVQAEREAGGGGPVEVTLEALPAGVEVTIADRGRGVPADLRQRLFHPFATGRAGGVGLGLALVHRIVTLHGGRIRLDDRAGGGTLAHLSFPGGIIATEGSNEEPPGLPGDAQADVLNS